MKVVIVNQQKDLSIRAVSVKPIVKEVLGAENLSTDEVTIYFVTTKEICRLHQDFFQDSSPTDCISFPLDDGEEQASGYHVLGEVFICPKTAIDYVQNFNAEKLSEMEGGKSKIETPTQGTEAIYCETTLYLVHGLLHLIGYDDIDEKKRKKMRAAETNHMEHLLNKKLLLKGS